MFFVVLSNDSFYFPLGLIKYIVIVVVIVVRAIYMLQAVREVRHFMK